MKHEFTLEFWEDDGWYVGKLREVPGVFSQGETLAELEENIADAYRMIAEETHGTDHPAARTKGITLEVA
jgi:predicted RNase H-like HicB family nuclease